MYHYTYLLLDPESEMKYIGMRSSKCKPEEDTYMGSAYAMTIHDKRRCDKLVLEEFDTREEALHHEMKLHNQFEVHTNPEFWNLSKQTSTKFISNRKGCKLTEEHKLKCSSALKGRKMPEFTEDHKRKISVSRIGTKASAETKKKFSESRQGENNSNFKHKTIYKWYKDNEYFVGTVGQLALKDAIKDKSALTREILEYAEDSIFDNDRASYEYDGDGIFNVTLAQEKDLTARIKKACDEWQSDNGISFSCSTFYYMSAPEWIGEASK